MVIKMVMMILVIMMTMVRMLTKTIMIWSPAAPTRSRGAMWWWRMQG